MRRDSAVLEPAEKITAAEMIRAVSLYQQMTQHQPAQAGDSELPSEKKVAEKEAADGEPDEAGDDARQTASDETPSPAEPQLLRPVSAGQRKRIEESRRRG